MKTLEHHEKRFPAFATRNATRRAAMASAAAVALTLAACSTGSPPVAEMASSRAVVQQAGTADARQYAPVELNAAEDKLRRAEQALKNKDYDQARSLAQEAQADASLASARARTQRADRALKQVSAAQGSGSSVGGGASQGAGGAMGGAQGSGGTMGGGAPQGAGGMQDQLQQRGTR